MKRCLWVVPKAIFPVRDGARVANRALLKSMRSHFNELDIMLLNEADSDELHISEYNTEFNPTNVYFFKRATFSNLIKKLIFLAKSFLVSPELPVTTGYFNTKKLKHEVSQILEHRKYDVIVFDGLHPYTVFQNLNEFKNIPVIYRAHNVEGDLWSTAASKTKNSIIQKLLLWQGQKMTKLEMKLVDYAQKVWCIAEEDLNRFKKLQSTPKDNLLLIPVGLDFKKTIHENQGKIKLLFLGKMDWAPNKDGLKWFLEEVWPNVDKEKVELQIVGSGDSSWGTELFSAPGVNFLGFAKDLEAVYANCDFSIIPIRYGSGTRIKVIESISKNVPIVSTDMGVQGSGLQDYFKAETASEWVSVLNSLDRAKGHDMAAKAFLELERMYSPAIIAEKAFTSIKF